MPTNGLRVNHYDFVALHSMWIIFSRSELDGPRGHKVENISVDDVE